MADLTDFRPEPAELRNPPARAERTEIRAENTEARALAAPPGAEDLEYAETGARLARHEAEARKSSPLYYDLLGDFVFWLDLLTRDRHGVIERSYSNLCRILEYDGRLQGIGYNRFTESFEVTAPLPWRQKPGPWRDADDAQLARYVDERYGNFPLSYYVSALEALADCRSFHPVVDYFRRLAPWDGKPRVETLLVDLLGAENSVYVRAVTRKTLCAAIHRLSSPGCKFDTILVLSGPQGIGKSTLLARLGMQWFSDNLSIADMNDKTGAELLQGRWIIEIGEMAGMKKADLEKVKAFLARQDDRYRAAYGRRVLNHPRQCVFFGTTNEDGYLRDLTGNRRFWTVPVTGESPRKPWELSPEEVDQIWAEALILASDEQLFLEAELEPEARRLQQEALERDDREGLVRDYLETLVPTDWHLRSYCERISWYLTPTSSRKDVRNLTRRDRTSNMEIWCECFGQPKQELTRRESAAISAIMARIPGWERSASSTTRGPYGTQRFYFRSPAPEPVQTAMSLNDQQSTNNKEKAKVPGLSEKS